jgi:hypothetical protein
MYFILALPLNVRAPVHAHITGVARAPFDVVLVMALANGLITITAPYY